MAFVSIIGRQGYTKFDLLSYSPFTKISSYLDSVIISNTSAKPSFDDINEIEENYKGDNVENFNGVKFEATIEVLNINSTDYQNIVKLFTFINLCKSRTDRILNMCPLYNTSGGNGFYCSVLFDGKLSLENIKEFLNVAQKFHMRFVHREKLSGLPINTDSNTIQVNKDVAGYVLQIM